VAEKGSFGGIVLILAAVGVLALAGGAYGVFVVVVLIASVLAWAKYSSAGAAKSGPAARLGPTKQRAPSFNLTVAIRGPGHVPGRVTSTNGDDYWQPLTLNGQPTGGWIYTGRGLAAVGGDGLEPALVDPSLPVDRSIQDCTVRRLDYWPSYAGASPEARGAYAHWLSTGRRDPTADLGYVFLYFYGLERRALHDALSSPAAQAELPAIEAEVERLLGIYTSSGSFQSYAGSLLDTLNASSDATRRYEQAPPPLRRGRDLTFEHRIALAQCAADGAPLPAEWAYSWFGGDPTTYLRTPARRCPEEFRRLFLLRYREVFGEGLLLPRTRTRLKLDRRPASPTFGFTYAGHTKTLDLPDVSVLTGPVRKLQKVAESCYARLDSYSRFIRNHTDLAHTLDALVELPVELWPTAQRASVEKARERVGRSDGSLAVAFEELASWFPGFDFTNRQKLRSLCRVLGEAGLGMEPDVRFGGSVPGAGTTVVLFADDPGTATTEPSASYSAAALTLQLGAAVAVADGVSSDSEKGLLTRQLGAQLQLSESESRRLHARLRLLLIVPPKLTGLKSRLDSLQPAQREAIGAFLALVALADGVVTPDEVSTLEKAFRLLGLDPRSVYSNLHVAATEPVAVRAELPAVGHPIPRPRPDQKGAAFQLDPSRVAALQADSERVATILGSIFASDVVEPESAPEPVDADEAEVGKTVLMGLGTEHSSFVRTLLTRARWTRAELEEIADEQGLMLDGALEQVNDAALNTYNRLLLEGTDPVDIDQEVVREVMQ
jgi:uncharacterized tellurite resistance protein B-like protein